MKTLALLRHAKSEWDDMDKRDFDRGINARGRKGAALVGKYIKSLDLEWGAVIASSAARVRQTLDVTLPNAGISTGSDAEPFTAANLGPNAIHNAGPDAGTQKAHNDGAPLHSISEHNPEPKAAPNSAPNIGPNSAPNTGLSTGPNTGLNTGPNAAKIAAPTPAIIYDERLYLAGTDVIVEMLQTHGGQAQNILLAGHNPGLQEMLFKLVPPAREGDLFDQAASKFPTSSLMILQLDIEDWADIGPDCGELIHFVRPRDLDPALGPDTR